MTPELAPLVGRGKVYATPRPDDSEPPEPAGAVSRARGRIVDLSEDTDFVPAEEVIRDTIPATGVGFLGGQSGAGKTFAAIELAFCLMTGAHFAGRLVDRPGGVIYVAFEGAGTIAGRVKARRALLADPGRSLPLLLVEGFGSVARPEDFAALRATISVAAATIQARWGVPVSGIVVDTVAASGMIPEDKENDPGAWTRVFDNMNPLSSKLKAPIILVHHYGKSADAGLRGSSNARAGADFALALTCDRDEITGNSSNHFLALTKSRTAPEGGIAAIALAPVEIGTRRDGTPVTSLVLRFDASARLAAPPKRKPSGSDRAFAAAFDEAVIAPGQRVRVHGEASAPEVTAVRVERVRDAFAKRYVTATSDEKKRADTVRKGFKSALSNAVSSRSLAVGAWGGEEWVWRIAGHDDERK
jgi:hypothetical protein